MLLQPASRRRRREPPRVAPVLIGLLVLAAVAAAGVLVVRARQHSADRRATVDRFATAWARQDTRAMWEQLDTGSKARWPWRRFAASYDSAYRAATVRRVHAQRSGGEHRGAIPVTVTVDTAVFGPLRGVVQMPVSTSGGDAGVTWTPHLRLPGLRAGESVKRVTLVPQIPASVVGPDGLRLDRNPVTAGIAGLIAKQESARLNGRPGAELHFGKRIVAKVPLRRGRSVHATIRPRLQRAAEQALGNRLGGVAVIRPGDGSVLAMAGLAVSAPQPPGSTFKIITLSAALRKGIATPSSSYPIRTASTLSGVTLRNANNEACGGSLANAFAVSCNSVFAPLGAKLGAASLVHAAEAFGFNEQPRIAAAKMSTIPQAADLKDSLAVGSSAIGQDKDLATPLVMASIAATIGEHGIRAKPRIVREAPVIRHRATSARVASQVRTMMLGVVRSGTGTAAAIPGVQVAGKTGTAELRMTTNGPPDPKNTDAWFVAFAPAYAPKVAVGVMLVGAGYGGAAAAPIARRVLQAAL